MPTRAARNLPMPRVRGLGRLQRWIRNARTRRSLAQLPPDLYGDVGLSPEAARREARRPFWIG